jgi:hypothetical protein
LDTFDKFCQLEYADSNMISMPHVDSNILDSAKVGVVKSSKFLRLSRSKEFCIAEMASLIDLLKKMLLSAKLAQRFACQRKISVWFFCLLNLQNDHCKGFLLLGREVF